MNPQPGNEPPQPSQRELERLHRHLLGELDADEFAELEKELLASPQARADFLRAARLDAALQDEATERQNTPAPPAAPFPFWRWLIVAAVAVFALAVGLWWHQSEPSLPVATLIDSRDCQWADGKPLPVEARLLPGVLKLTSGIALIEFDDGARLALQGPATLELSGTKTARLVQGLSTVRCDEGAEGFTLQTPQSTVIDLGTEFGVAVGRDGATAVEVLEGSVEVASASPKPEPAIRFLAAGDSLRIAPDGSESTASPVRETWIRDYSSAAERLADTLPPQIFVHDAFHHQGVGLPDYEGGHGWAGPWWNATPTVSGELHFTQDSPISKLSSEPGDSLVVGTGLELRRSLASPIDPTRRQRLYIAFSLQRLQPKLKDTNGRVGEATLLLRSSSNPANFIGFGLSGLNRWASSDQGGWERSEKPANGSGPFFLVIRLDLRPIRGHEVAMVAFDASTPVPMQEPETWDLVTHRKIPRTAAKLDTLALRVRPPSAFKFGEVSIGNSWLSVTNPAAAGR